MVLGSSSTGAGDVGDRRREGSFCREGSMRMVPCSSSGALGAPGAEGPSRTVPSSSSSGAVPPL
ncbi:hypothetical protein B005_3478 [Nocardiopsis alba ATCC BAA-2165]|uniref:Uncharacterized protein n=1 Tax=Nocardiopsis alba (strain ATCC BAA-2165 / BE74) TaxID=1205910 RepID=J7LCJ3_NOCAA|nr:hypothetical protein B005_3478 [Nocardiopsis alba ATCC BAA-2165]